MPDVNRSIATAVLALILSVPVLGSDGQPGYTKPSTLEGSALTWCGDVDPIPVDPSLFGDSPVYIGNEQPVQKVRTWARQQPGFEDIWIDRDHLGWLVLAFSQGAHLRQAELKQRFPDDGVVAVGVEHTTRELRALQRRLGKQLSEFVDSWSTSVDVTANITEVSVPYITAEIVAELEARFGGEPFCIDGRDPSDQPVAGPQPIQGDGWSLVGYQHKDARGKSYRTGLATDATQYRRLWERSDVTDEAPEVDFEQNVVLWFAIGHGSSCPNLRMDDVLIDHETAVIYPQVVDLDGSVMCTDDLVGTYQYVVALDRGQLPTGPFVVQMSGPDRYGAGRDQTVVEVDLTGPGTGATKGDIHAAVTAGKQPPARSGSFIEPFGKWEYVIDASCGIGYLGQLNDIDWVTDQTDVPDAWLPLVGPDDELLVSIAIRAKPQPHVDATLDGHTVRYLPAAQAPPVCET